MSPRTDSGEVDVLLERVQQMLYGMRREHLQRIATAAGGAASIPLLLWIFGFPA